MEDKIYPSEKQLNRVNKIRKHLGDDVVIEYMKHFWSSFSFNTMTKKQAQKVITGLDNRLPRKPIYGICYNCWKG